MRTTPTRRSARSTNSALTRGSSSFGVAGGPTLTKVNQTGGTSYPANNSNWGLEIALDVEWAHAIAPKANILLVEANSSSFSDLTSTAVSYAKSVAAVTVVSMSFGAGEFSGETGFDSIFTTPAGHQGITYVASTGDNGSPGGYPAYSPNVVAVGGTTLTSPDSVGTYGTETGWTGSGGGISTQENKPTYQAAVTQSATKRTIPDVSMDADSNSGVYVLDLYNGGYFQVGGTSLSAPMWGGLIAIANQGRVAAGGASMNGLTDTLPALYSLPASNFHDITSGSNGGFSAIAGYDLVTGRGTPIANTLVPALVGNTPSTPDLLAASDSGISNTDNITNVTLPTFTGTATTGSTVTIYSDSVAVGSGVAAANAYSITITTPLTNGTHTIIAKIGSISSPSSLSVTIDTVAPSVTTSAFDYTGVSMQDVSFGFSEDVSATLTNTDLTLLNTTTATTIPSANISQTYASNTGVFRFPGYTYGALPDGNYTATLPLANVTDVAGNPLSANGSLTFFSLAGDFNHDRTVDVTDLGILATNWQASGKTFAQGDTTYNGTVDVSDLGVLATNWQKTLPSSAEPLAKASFGRHADRAIGFAAHVGESSTDQRQRPEPRVRSAVITTARGSNRPAWRVRHAGFVFARHAPGS